MGQLVQRVLLERKVKQALLVLLERKVHKALKEFREKQVQLDQLEQ
jgi:hypothetical protein